LKKDNKFGKKSELSAKPAKCRNTGQRETKEVLAELENRPTLPKFYRRTAA
jgi:hypothetical protein